MSLKADIFEDIPGTCLRVEVFILQVNRGVGPIVDYAVRVWSVIDGYATRLPGGEAMLPPDMIRNIKLKLWESLKP